MLHIGDLAPDFQIDGRLLSQWLPSGPVVVYFYPADFTPVCSKEACLFRDAHQSLAAAGVRVVGVSPQGQTSHDRFKKFLSLPYNLVSDVGMRIIRSYGCTGMFGLPLPFGVRRVTFLVGPDQRILDRATGELRLRDHDRLLKQAAALPVLSPRSV